MRIRLHKKAVIHDKNCNCTNHMCDKRENIFLTFPEESLRRLEKRSLLSHILTWAHRVGFFHMCVNKSELSFQLSKPNKPAMSHGGGEGQSSTSLTLIRCYENNLLSSPTYGRRGPTYLYNTVLNMRFTSWNFHRRHALGCSFKRDAHDTLGIQEIKINR